MGKVPILSGKEIVKILERHGYTSIRQNGSHIRLKPPDGRPEIKMVTVPLHKEVRTPLLKAILRDAGIPLSSLE